VKHIGPLHHARVASYPRTNSADNAPTLPSPSGTSCANAVNAFPGRRRCAEKVFEDGALVYARPLPGFPEPSTSPRCHPWSAYHCSKVLAHRVQYAALPAGSVHFPPGPRFSRPPCAVGRSRLPTFSTCLTELISKTSCRLWPLTASLDARAPGERLVRGSGPRRGARPDSSLLDITAVSCAGAGLIGLYPPGLPSVLHSIDWLSVGLGRAEVDTLARIVVADGESIPAANGNAADTILPSGPAPLTFRATICGSVTQESRPILDQRLKRRSRFSPRVLLTCRARVRCWPDREHHPSSSSRGSVTSRVRVHPSGPRTGRQVMGLRCVPLGPMGVQKKKKLPVHVPPRPAEP